MGRTLRGTDKVLKNLEDWRLSRYAVAQQTCERVIGPMLESRARSDAPWTDRTGNARRGLFARTKVTTSDVVLDLCHTVYYGVFLELGYAGRFAVLEPTLQRSASEIEAILRKALK